MANYTNEASAYPHMSPPRRAGEAGARKSKARATAFMLVALVAGVTASWLITRAIAQRTRLATSPTTKVAVAALDLPLATTLKPEMISFVEWPTTALPPGHHPDVAKLQGRVTGRDVLKGEPLLESRLAASGTGEGMAAVIPPTHRAMTVQVNEVIGVAGFIHPNDVVDVITTMQPNPGSQDIRAKIVLQNVRVLAVGQQMVTQNAKPVKVPVVTLLVTPEESERLALSATFGKIQLTLRSRSDSSEITTRGISPPELLAGAPTPSKTAPPVALAKSPKEPEIVEVLRGDRLEERKLRAKDLP